MKTLVVAAGIAAGLVCGAPVMAQTKPTVAIIVKEATSPHWRALLAGARKAGEDLGVTVSELGAQSESDASATFEKAVASKPAAIIIAPALFGALAPRIDEAAKQIKIIGIGPAGDTKAMTTLLATDNVNAGRIAANALASGITGAYGDTEGNVVIISSMPAIVALDQRIKGFKEVLAAKYRALAIVSDKTADGNPTTAFSMMNDFIANTADLRGAFVTDPIVAQAVGQAVAEKKSDDKIVVVGFGADEKLVEFLQSGTIDGLVLEDPFRMGYESVKTALAASKGEQVPANVDIGATLVTKANMSSPHSQELLHPKMK
jgi:ribose transport system substrate-binding protein